MEHVMSNIVRKKYEKGKWYKDQDGDFVKFIRFDGELIIFLATCYDGNYVNGNNQCGVGYFNNQCIPMTIDEMKEYLPKEEWWTEPNNELFPIY